MRFTSYPSKGRLRDVVEEGESERVWSELRVSMQRLSVRLWSRCRVEQKVQRKRAATEMFRWLHSSAVLGLNGVEPRSQAVKRELIPGCVEKSSEIRFSRIGY